MASNRCPKCQGTMTEGFGLYESHGWRKLSSWVEGAPQKSVWTGIKLSGRRQIPVRTWRCTRCGFLESYANA